MDKIDLNKVLLVLSLATNLLVAVAAIIIMIQVPVFQFIIIEIYVLVVSILVFLSDLHRPVICQEHFSFLKYFWGRFLLYLILGALVFVDTDPAAAVSFTEFAGGWTWAMAGLFGLLFLFTLVDKHPAGGKTIEPIRMGASKGGANNTSTMSSRA